MEYSFKESVQVSSFNSIQEAYGPREVSFISKLISENREVLVTCLLLSGSQRCGLECNRLTAALCVQRVDVEQERRLGLLFHEKNKEPCTTPSIYSNEFRE